MLHLLATSIFSALALWYQALCFSGFDLRHSVFWHEGLQKITLGLLWFKFLPQAKHDRLLFIGLRCFVFICIYFLWCLEVLLNKRREDKETFSSLNLFYWVAMGISGYRHHPFIHSCNQSYPVYSLSDWMFTRGYLMLMSWLLFFLLTRISSSKIRPLNLEVTWVNSWVLR